MTLQDFVQRNRQELDKCIALATGQTHNPYPNDAERKDWIKNDESLYEWAKSEGVRI